MLPSYEKLLSLLQLEDEKKIKGGIEDLLDEVCKFLDGDRAYFFSYSPVFDTVSNEYEWCRDGVSPQIDELQNVPFDVFPNWKQAHLNKNPYIIDDVASSEDESEREALLPQGIKSLISMPIFNNEEYKGFIGVDFVEANRNFTSREVYYMEEYGRFFAIVLTHLQSKKQTDDLKRIISQVESNQVTGAWELDVKTNKTYWTPGVYNIYDVPKDFDHNLLAGVAHYIGSDQKLIEKSLNTAIKEKKPFSVKARIKSAKNTIKHVEVTGTYVEDKNGKRVIGSIRDISDAYRLKSALGVSEKLFAISSEIGKVATILIEDEHFKANAYFSKLFGLPLYGKKQVASLNILMTSEDKHRINNIDQLLEYFQHKEDHHEYFLVKTFEGDIWMDVYLKKAELPNDSNDFYVVAFRNIDDIKRKVIKEKENAFWLKESQRIGKIGHFLYNQKTDFFEVNEELNHILGKKNKIHKIEDLFNYFESSNKKIILLKWLRFLKNGAPFVHSGKFITGKQTQKILSVKISNGDSLKSNRDYSDLYLGIVKDITNEWINQKEIKNKSQLLDIAADKASHELRAGIKRLEGIVNVFDLNSLTEKEKSFLLNSIATESKQLDVYMKSIIEALNKRYENAKL